MREHHLLAGHSRDDQDKAIHQARREGKVTAGAAEGRHGSTERERKAYIREDGEALGHLMVKNSVNNSDDGWKTLEGGQQYLCE